MLEAVNSVLSNAPLVRAQAEQQSTARSLAANPEQVQVVPQAPYISPYIKMDINYDKAIILIRDADTGDTVRQIPSEPALEAARRQIAAQVRGDAVSDRIAPTPQEAKIETPAPQVQTATPAASTAAFGAFAKQVASLQTAVSGGGTGSTVSLSA
ncbi:MAG: hypothetical protein ACXW4B_11130 [Micavibrio sp.]